MRVGIDFDNTIVNTFDTSKYFLDEYLPGNKLNSYHELSMDEQIKFFEKYYLKITENLTIYPGFKETLNYLKNKGIKVILITARGQKENNIINATKSFLKKNEIYFDEMIFGSYPKGKEAFHNKIDLIIDDSQSVIEDAKKYNIKTIHYGKDVNNWYEILEIFRKENL